MKALRLTSIYVLFVGLFVLYWVIYAASPEFHARFLQGEDRGVEWLTFAGFLGAFVLAAVLLRRHKRMSRRALAYFVFLALFFFACAGEEISWGQRLLGFQTPESMTGINEQGEFNIHNLDIKHFHPKDIVSWFMKTWGLILPLVLVARLRHTKDPMRRYLPSPALVPCFAFGEVINLFEKPFTRFIESRLGEAAAFVVVNNTEELLEMYWGLSALLAMGFIWMAWRRTT